MRKRRLSTDRIVLKHPGYFRLKELCWYLQVSSWSIKRWSGLSFELKPSGFRKEVYKPYMINEFPQPIRKEGEISWLFSVEEIFEYLGVEEEKKTGSELKIISPLLTVRQVSNRVSRNERTVRQWFFNGWVGVMHFGFSNTRVEEKELSRFIDAYKTHLDLWKPIQPKSLDELRRQQVSKKRVNKVVKRRTLPYLRRTHGVSALG